MDKIKLIKFRKEMKVEKSCNRNEICVKFLKGVLYVIMLKISFIVVVFYIGF